MFFLLPVVIFIHLDCFGVGSRDFRLFPDIMGLDRTLLYDTQCYTQWLAGLRTRKWTPEQGAEHKGI